MNTHTALSILLDDDNETHWTQRGVKECLENGGYIKIIRPKGPNGLSHSQSTWHYELTEKGDNVFEELYG